MSTTSTTTTTPFSSRVRPLIERARAAYEKVGGQRGSHDTDDVRDINNATIITLRDASSILATYRLDGTALKRITDLSRYDMPFEDRREFVAAVIHLFGKAGDPSVRAHTIATQQKLLAAAVAGGFEDGAVLAAYIERGALTQTALDLAFDAITCAGGVDACFDIIEVDAMFASAFNVPRDPRSPEYRAGALAALQFRVDGTPIPHPYPAGTAADDAYYSGQAEGHSIWRRARDASTEFAKTGRIPTHHQQRTFATTPGRTA